MKSPEQVKWDFVQQWLSKAHKDLLAATVLLEADLEDYENVGFHAQQAAEKYIKALLVRHQIEFPKTHDIAILRQLVGQVDQRTAERLAAAENLTPYGVMFRYPGAFTLVSREEGERALRLGEQVRDIVLNSLKPYLETGRPGS
ncbi:MAG: HEPN domain-containing protein [Gemmatimonadetes bacterium]|jgi:HEPN domain-containing protein|nr:HEPN domain-containing protein [Gemmatimonadota bacterium]